MKIHYSKVKKEEKGTQDDHGYKGVDQRKDD